MNVRTTLFEDECYKVVREGVTRTLVALDKERDRVVYSGTSVARVAKAIGMLPLAADRFEKEMNHG